MESEEMNSIGNKDVIKSLVNNVKVSKSHKLQLNDVTPKNIASYLTAPGRNIPTKLKTRVSHFIYEEPKHIQLYSLTYDCPKCKLPCEKILDTFTNKCEYSCLCNKNSPVISYQKYSNNSEGETDYMLEAEKRTLDDDRITDLKRLPNIQKTEVIVLRDNTTITHGDDIKIILKLFDGYGKSLQRGGDDIRVRMTYKNLKQVAGRVQDFNNGTYLVTVPAIWNGTSVIGITVPYFREERAMLFRWFRQFQTLFYHRGLFQNKGMVQATLCSIRASIPGYGELCDVSFYNGGDPYFCGKPPSKNLSCADFSATGDYRLIDIGVTRAEQTCASRGCTNFGREIKQISVTIKGAEDTRAKLPDCKDLPLSQTWNLTTPTGYFVNGSYYPTKCQTRDTKRNITKCLQNTNLVLVGDSTILQWFKYLRTHSNCIMVTQNWTTGKWYEDSLCVNKEWKFNLRFIPHNMPISAIDIKHHAHKPSTKSMSTLFGEIPAKGRFIFVLHLYAHFTRMHYNIFRDQIRAMLPSLKKALQRNKDLRVVVKGSHIYYCVGWVPNLNDFLAPHLMDIIQNEMGDFKDRILYLDYWDMTVAVKNKLMHAGGGVIYSMIDLLFQHTCY